MIDVVTPTYIRLKAGMDFAFFCYMHCSCTSYSCRSSALLEWFGKNWFQKYERTDLTEGEQKGMDKKYFSLFQLHCIL